MLARIYQPAKTAMQSGSGAIKEWVLEFELSAAQRLDPLMGWTSGSDMTATQVRLKFPTRQEAVAYCRERKIPHQVIEKPEEKPVIKAYSDNFAFRRRKPWTH